MHACRCINGGGEHEEGHRVRELPSVVVIVLSGLIEWVERGGRVDGWGQRGLARPRRCSQYAAKMRAGLKEYGAPQQNVVSMYCGNDLSPNPKYTLWAIEKATAMEERGLALSYPQGVPSVGKFHHHDQDSLGPGTHKLFGGSIIMLEGGGGGLSANGWKGKSLLLLPPSLSLSP